MKQKVNEIKRMQKLAGLLTESAQVEQLGNIIDQMMDSEEGLDQGLQPSELIDYTAVQQTAGRLGLHLNIDKLKQAAKANDTGFLYSGEDLVRIASSNLD